MVGAGSPEGHETITGTGVPRLMFWWWSVPCVLRSWYHHGAVGCTGLLSVRAVTSRRKWLQRKKTCWGTNPVAGLFPPFFSLGE